MKIQALFGLIIVTFVILFAAYDALKNRKQTEIVSIAWHSIKWILLTGIAGYVYYNFYGFTADGWQPALWTAIATWWLFDLTYNFINGQPWHYAGDGKGSVLEKIVKWISLKVKIDMAVVLHMLKLTVTLIAVFITL